MSHASLAWALLLAILGPLLLGAVGVLAVLVGWRLLIEALERRAGRRMIRDAQAGLALRRAQARRTCDASGYWGERQASQSGRGSSAATGPALHSPASSESASRRAAVEALREAERRETEALTAAHDRLEAKYEAQRERDDEDAFRQASNAADQA